MLHPALPRRSGNDVEAPQSNTTERSRVTRAKEDTIGRPGKTTLAKREREKALQMHRKEKEAKRVLRKAEKASRSSTPEGEDPDLAGLRWGPQAPLY